MRPTEIMRGSPPAPETQVTRANWRSFPAIRWGFTHTREVLPTAEVRRSAHPTPIRSAPHDLSKLAFTAPDGSTTLSRRRCARPSAMRCWSCTGVRCSTNGTATA